MPILRPQLTTLLVVASLIVVAGCDASEPAAETAAPGPTATTTTTAAPAAPTTVPPILVGGQVVVAGDQEPPTLNPLVPGGDNDIVFALAHAYIPGAYDVGPDLELIPDLVEELPTPENDGVVIEPDGSMTVTWRILSEAVWADGVPISGDDFAFALELPQVPWANGADVALPEIRSVETTGKSITVNFAEPTIEYARMFRWVVPRHAVAGSDFDRDWNTKMWPSGGPFTVAEWTPGDSLRLIRNEHYWKTDAATGRQLPYLDSVVYRFLPSDEQLAAAISSGEVDLAFLRAPTADELRRIDTAGAEVVTTPGTIEEDLLFSFGADDPTGTTLNSSLAYRRAIASALDRRALAAAWPGSGNPTAANGLLAGDTGPWAAYRYDPAIAAGSLAAACQAADRNCAVDAPPVRILVDGNVAARVSVAIAAATMLRDAGFAAEVDINSVVDADPYNSPWDLTIMSRLVAAGPDRVLERFRPFDPGPSLQPRYEYRWAAVTNSMEAARFDDLLAEMRAALDPAEMGRLAAAAEQILADQVVAVPLLRRPVVSVVRPGVAGYVSHPSRAAALWSIEQWHLATGATTGG